MIKKYLFLKNFLLISILFMDITVPEYILAQEKSNNVKKARKEIWYEYEPSDVTLIGELIIKEAYGPPNYGEDPKHDKKIAYFVIKLDKPINVKGNPQNELNVDSIKGIKEIQLEPMYEINWKELLGKKVIISGKLHEKIFGSDYTDVLIVVNKIKLYKILKLNHL